MEFGGGVVIGRQHVYICIPSFVHLESEQIGILLSEYTYLSKLWLYPMTLFVDRLRQTIIQQFRYKNWT